MAKSKFEFYGQIEERESGFVILIPSSLSGIARGLKGQQRKVLVEL
jgi:hypothetical protein